MARPLEAGIDIALALDQCSHLTAGAARARLPVHGTSIPLTSTLCNGSCARGGSTPPRLTRPTRHAARGKRQAASGKRQLTSGGRRNRCSHSCSALRAQAPASARVSCFFLRADDFWESYFWPATMAMVEAAVGLTLVCSSLAALLSSAEQSMSSVTFLVALLLMMCGCDQWVHGATGAPLRVLPCGRLTQHSPPVSPDTTRNRRRTRRRGSCRSRPTQAISAPMIRARDDGTVSHC